MADTIVNTPSGREVREVYDSGNDMASWVVALAIIVVLVLGAVYLLPRLASQSAAPTQQTPSNINVTLPTGSGAVEGPAGGTGGTNSTGNSGGTNY